MKASEIRQKAVIVRRGASLPDIGPYLVISIPKWVNQTAELEPGETVVVSSEKPGEVVIRRLANLPESQQKLHHVRPTQLSADEVAQLKQGWTTGMAASQMAVAMDISRMTTVKYYRQFEAGRK